MGEAWYADRYGSNLVPYKKKYPDNLEQARLEYDRDLAELVRKDKPDLIVCAGFMHSTTVFISPPSRIIVCSFSRKLFANSLARNPLRLKLISDC